VALPVLSWRGEFAWSIRVAGVVMVEVLIVVANGMRCPLTAVAARYTEDRRSNFDIYLPEWLARNNQKIFGTLYGLGLAYTAWRYWG
jgi:hypothetical protein